MFRCNCGIWINCSILDYQWNNFAGHNYDCTERCQNLCFAQTYHPQYRSDWGYFDNIYQSQEYQNQMVNKYAHVGTVADNFFR